MRLSSQKPRRTRCTIYAEAARHYRAAPVMTRVEQTTAYAFDPSFIGQCRKNALMVTG